MMTIGMQHASKTINDGLRLLHKRKRELKRLARELDKVNLRRHKAPEAMPEFGDTFIGPMSDGTKRLYVLFQETEQRHRTIHQMLRGGRQNDESGRDLESEHNRIIDRLKLIDAALQDSIGEEFPNIGEVMQGQPGLAVKVTRDWMIYAAPSQTSLLSSLLSQLLGEDPLAAHARQHTETSGSRNGSSHPFTAGIGG